MQHRHTHKRSPLEIQQLAEFDTTLGDLPEQETRRRRILYLNDAVQQMHLEKNLLKSFGCVIIPFLMIPIFWPMLLLLWFLRKKAAEQMNFQLNNALEYWRIRREELELPAA